MKIFCLISLSVFTTFAAIPNKPVDKVDVSRFAGKWYSLSSIPTAFDKGTRETTTTYTLNTYGYFSVITTAKKDDNEVHTYKSKLFPDAKQNNAEMKAQFIWPFKVDYWVIDLAKDYSYVVVGHPEHKFLFIMSRKPALDKKLYDGLVAKCKAMGYPVEKLTSQHHD
ncbi:lipocalin family protein [Mucilaginibacter antarcticus]|uniref:Lipocalin family protein n=1 Tax=Mucilaginibacter antarcticus TaxID=1855725 RepID=A0ABW5XJK8_9SPHI